MLKGKDMNMYILLANVCLHIDFELAVGKVTYTNLAGLIFILVRESVDKQFAE